MNFLELINKCLLELNYKQVNAFSELTKNDHKRILVMLNIVNKEICNANEWNFLLRRTSIELKANTTEIKNTINGRILSLFIDGRKYEFQNDIEPFILGKITDCKYSSFGDKLLFPKFNKDKTVEVIYYTKNCVLDYDQNEKIDFESEKDKSLIPMPYAEQLLVYGTCMRLKANPQYFKFPYWMSMYKEAMLNLRAKTSVSATTYPIINLFRN